MRKLGSAQADIAAALLENKLVYLRGARCSWMNDRQPVVRRSDSAKRLIKRGVIESEVVIGGSGWARLKLTSAGQEALTEVSP